MLEATRWTIACTWSGLSVGAGAGGDQHRGGGGVLLVGEDLLGRQREVDDGGVDAVDRLDGLGELALHRPLEVGLLLELRGGDVLVVEQRVAAVAAPVGRPSPLSAIRVE